MVREKSLTLFLFVSLFLFSCASGGKKERNQIRELVKTSQFSAAINLLENSKDYKDSDNRLLLLMEKGLILHLKGDYYQSSQVLEEAKELGRKLYTTSFSNKVQQMIANDNYDIYYGERYEISLIHFYQALNHLLIAKQGYYEAYTVKEGKDGLRQIPKKELSAEEIRQRKMSARAEVLSWDSFLKEIGSERRGRSVFKNDMLAKVFGAFIHEMIGTRADLQIALQLYKDAHSLLIRNYGAYKSFNQAYKEYNSNYSSFPSLGEQSVKAKYINETAFQKKLKEFLNERIVDLSLNIRPNSLKELKNQYSVTDELIKKVKKIRNPNVTIVFQKGLIPLKVGKKEYFGLGQAINDPKAGAAAKIGAAVLTVFAADKLGLLPPPRSYTPAGAYLGIKVAEAAVSSAAISFELPKIQNMGLEEVNSIVIKNLEGELVAENALALVAPLGDIAEQAIAENAASLYTRMGTRLALKHIAAIVAAYGTYRALSQNKDNSFFARQAAVFQYLATAKGIEASESADTRYWSTLPSDVWIGRFKLPAGNYQVYARVMSSGAQKEIHLGPLSVKNGLADNFANFKSLH